MARRIRSARSCVVLASLLAASAQAQSIPLVNPGFELPAVLPNASWTGGGPGVTTVPGWSFVSGPPGWTWGVWQPTISGWGYRASEGVQTLYVGGAVVEQVTSALAQAGQTYTLQVDVVRHPTQFSASYSIQLRAGSVVLATDNGSVTPAAGGFATSTLVAMVPAGSPAINQPLTIRMTGQTQMDLDNVRLFGSASACYANCDGSTGTPALTAADFACFLQKFRAGDAYANCDGSSGTPTLTAGDFACFLQKFRAGCP